MATCTLSSCLRTVAIAHASTNKRSTVTNRPAKVLSSKLTPLLAVKSFASVSRRSNFTVKAAKEPETTFDSEEIVKTLTEKWESTQNKTTIFAYGGGIVFLLWISATIVGAINTIPVLPKLFELVGLGYTSWFVYRYLLFKSSRKDLVADVEELKAKISGEVEKEA
eukprot:CAMPEP_0196579188 /NCGR_PEP_ID=MMETSP1081-20130531/18308_1 /TAXON_ID=36882 /ORGANISM="Pyramimonas amylifera, Strain CCMP720" /LENGTH=165 /DNA_ID=CAMNT_0041898671 /DNA_START=72 /DNA_END=569 /DNA_ORIENTATION=-